MSKPDIYGPDCLSIITTYQCSAECQECCFECGPDEHSKLSLSQIKLAIDSAVKMKTIRFIVWTGGECSLLGNDLVEAISYANIRGLPSRIVSNGWWATSESSANKLLRKWINAGLIELNISTGDNHQEFVSANTAILAATTAAKLGISSVISVEKTDHSRFSPEDLIQNSIYKKFVDAGINVEKLQIINPVWVSFHKDTKYNYSETELESPALSAGCDNIFTFIGVNPDGNQIGCCGLTMRYIGSISLGNIQNVSIEQAYYSQYNDFLKRWIFVEGALTILEQVKKWDNSVQIPRFPHNCHYCAYLFNSQKVRKIIVANYKEVQARVDKNFQEKINWYKLKAAKGILEYG